MFIVVCCSLRGACWLLFVVCRPLLGVGWLLLDVVCCMLFVGCFNGLPAGVGCVVFAV